MIRKYIIKVTVLLNRESRKGMEGVGVTGWSENIF